MNDYGGGGDYDDYDVDIDNIDEFLHENYQMQLVQHMKH